MIIAISMASELKTLQVRLEDVSQFESSGGRGGVSHHISPRVISKFVTGEAEAQMNYQSKILLQYRLSCEKPGKTGELE